MRDFKEQLPVLDRSLVSLLGNPRTFSICINIPINTKVWVATGMLTHYLESFTDSLVVRDGFRVVGLVAGKDIIENLMKNPTSDFMDNTKVEDIMEKEVFVASTKTTLRDLLLKWKQTRRAFAIIKNEFFEYSSLSVRKILEISAKCNTTQTISQLPTKKAVTFKKDDTVGDVINSMLENKTRKLLLEGTEQFINDRVIFEKITKELDYLRGVDNFLDLPIDHHVELPKAKVISQDVTISEASKIMCNMLYPYVIFKDQAISPWDICMSLFLDDIT